MSLHPLGSPGNPGDPGQMGTPGFSGPPGRKGDTGQAGQTGNVRVQYVAYLSSDPAQVIFKHMAHLCCLVQLEPKDLSLTLMSFQTHQNLLNL